MAISTQTHTPLAQRLFHYLLILHSSGYACIVRKPQSRQGFSYIQLTRHKQSVNIRTSNWSFLKTASMSIRSFFDPVLSGIFESNFSFSKIRQIPRLEYILTNNPGTIRIRIQTILASVDLHCNENPIYVFPEKELRPISTFMCL